MKTFINTLCILFSLSFSEAAGQSFYTEDFSDNPFENGWNSEDISGNEVEWNFCKNSILCGLENPPFQAATAENGFVTVRSWLHSNILFNHTSRLSAPTLDCSDKDAVFLEFETSIITYNIHAATGARIKVRSDGGQWAIFYPFPSIYEDPGTIAFSRNPEKITLDISAVAARQQEVEIVWEWEGKNEDFWAIDDVKLFDHEPFYKDVIWGQNPGEGDFDGGFNGWTYKTLRGFSPDEHTWKWDSIGYVGDAVAMTASALADYADFPFIDSYTYSNGAAVFNADYYQVSSGHQANPREFLAELISPSIDLSSQQEDPELRFSQFGFFYVPNQDAEYPTAISVSIDGGDSWLPQIPINVELSVHTPVSNNLNVPLHGVAGHSNVKIKFIFSTPLYFWVIDDVLLAPRKHNDMRVFPDFFAIAPNAVTPASQVDNFGFLAEFENRGLHDQTNVKSAVVIENNEDGSILFSDTVHIGTLGKDERLENIFFANNFFPPQTPGSYRGTYRIFSNETDEFPEDNELSWQFFISDTIFAKETGPTTKIVPINTTRFRYGNCFFVPKGHGWYASDITFGIANTEDLDGKLLVTYLYKFYVDENKDYYAADNEIELLATNGYVITGNEHVINGGLITIPVSESNMPVPLEDNVHYIVAVEYDDIGGEACQMYASNEYNYLATWFMADSLERPRYAGVEDDNGKFDLLGFNLEYTPVIRLHITSKGPSAVRKMDFVNNNISIYPNPAHDKIDVTFSGGISGESVLTVTNALGEKILTKPVQNIEGNFHERLLLNSISPGIYYLTIETSNGIFSKKFIINPR